MRGFATRTSVADAMAWIDREVGALGNESVTIEQATGRVLAEAAVAPRDVPDFDRSAMDGFAVVAEETIGASDYNPLSFEIVGTSLPGHPAGVSVRPGQAVRIMTGAPVPHGASAVVPAEYANETRDRVEISQPVAAGKHIGIAGEDIRRGEQLLTPGRVLRPQDAGVIASLGCNRISASLQPRVRVIVTGSEVIPAGSEPKPFEIFDANSPMLRGLIARDGGVLSGVEFPGDDRNALGELMRNDGAEVILVSGGSSVGSEDHAPEILREAGEVAVHGIAMRPSSPAGFGRIGNTLVFLLPGNPVSCLCAYDFFAGRAIRRLGNRNPEWPYRREQHALSAKISSAIGRLDYCRVRIDNECARPLAISGASILSSTVRADGFVIVPESLEGYAEESVVDVYRY